MAKKINNIGIAVKAFLEKGFSQIWIARKLGIKKQNVNYWAKHPFKPVQTRRRKLEDKYIKKILNLASDQTTSNMSSAKIVSLINKDLKNDGKNMTIHKATVCRILNKELGKPRKIKKVFYLSEKQKQKRVEFCKLMLEKGISGQQILFTDETRIEMGSYIHDSIRLSKETTKNLKKGDKDAFKLINRPERKYEPSIMVGGGINSHGLTNLILMDGPVNEFSYAQSLLFYKDSFDELQKKTKANLFFEQDGATSHTTSSNIKLIEQLFGGKKLIQNPPNSPDLAYPIENIWGYLKPRVKNRGPKTLDELKRYTLEEWNNIPKKIVEKCGHNYIRRLKKVIELEGERLEPYHLSQIEKEASLPSIEEINENVKEARELKMKIAFNDQKLNSYRKKEIAHLNKEIKKISKNTREKCQKLNETKRVAGIVQYRKRKKKLLKEKKKKDIGDIKEEINSLKKMNIEEYLAYLREKEKKMKKADDEESTIEESIEKILKIKEIRENFEIPFEIEF